MPASPFPPPPDGATLNLDRPNPGGAADLAGLPVDPTLVRGSIEISFPANTQSLEPEDALPVGSGPSPMGPPPADMGQEATGPEAPGPEPPVLPDRYDRIGLIGVGGMGEVWRVRDRDLNRVLALKVVHHRLSRSRTVLARFVEEAQATAQLEHPGIVPVHEWGQLADGRHFFTMKEVRGHTLTAVIAAAHGDNPPAGLQGWSRARLLDAFRRTCEAVAHAHALGVIHRDLKPANIMIGAFGEVLVLDWGLAKIRGRPDHADAAGDLDPVRTARSEAGAHLTRLGTVAGTPAYMPPEQARGRTDLLDARSDVYALGAILYELLVGHPPYAATTSEGCLEAVLTGPPPALPGGIPEELVAVCERCMAREAAERFPDAGAVASELATWLEGARRRGRALELVARAESAAPDVAALRRHAVAARQEAVRMALTVPAWAPVRAKAPIWELEDAATRLEDAADAREFELSRDLQGALTHAPDLPEAHALLARLYRQRHAVAEAARDWKSARRHEALLRAHDDGRHAAYLAGEGALTLHTDPPGARVRFFVHRDRGRMLVPVPVEELPDWRHPLPTHTPIEACALPMGSYLLRIEAAGRDPIDLPVQIEREAHADGVCPGHRTPLPLRLPRPGEINPSECLVPPGWTWIGAQNHGSLELPRRRVWVDGFVIQRVPVTNADYIAFLDALVAGGEPALALHHSPRGRAAGGERTGQPIYGQDAWGRFLLRPDPDGDAWLPDYPVLLVDWFSASAYAEWWAEHTGAPWRLPGELEWEKAARGVDGRTFPWGDHFDATRACVRESREGRPLPARVLDFPSDRSPFGVLGMAGNASDWCADAYSATGPPISNGRVLAPTVSAPGAGTPRVLRGGSWSYTRALAGATLRREVAATYASETVSFRLVRPWAPA